MFSNPNHRFLHNCTPLLRSLPLLLVRCCLSFLSAFGIGNDAVRPPRSTAFALDRCTLSYLFGVVDTGGVGENQTSWAGGWGSLMAAIVLGHSTREQLVDKYMNGWAPLLFVRFGQRTSVLSGYLVSGRTTQDARRGLLI